LPYKILNKRELGNSGTLFEMELTAPLISKKSFAGNFVLLRINERGERFPLTIADYSREKGSITIVFQVVGKSTKLLSHQNVGDEILDLVGPLGNDIHIEKYEHPVIVIGGGVGIAPCYPQIKELKSVGNEIITIIGARNKDLLFWKEKVASISDQLIICTDDGSEGIKGVVTDPLREIILQKPISLVIAIGPLIMMKYVALLTNGKADLPKIKTMVSLNPIMVDGTGMCGGCRVEVEENGEKGFIFACVDGPDVDGHIVDFDNLIKRSQRFTKSEKICLNKYDHQCKAINKLDK
jgi:ferredoxin--NADP+ reductase